MLVELRLPISGNWPKVVCSSKSMVTISHRVGGVDCYGVMELRIWM